MDGKNEFKLRILPERLNGAIEIALRERRSYASAKDLFLQTSQLQRQSAGGYRHDKSSSKDLKAVYSKTSNKVSADSASNSDNDSDSDHKNKDDKVKCYNCQKFGHISSQCTERCTRCSKSKHKSKNCPKRVDNDQKKKRKKNKVSESDSSSEDSEKEDAVKSKKQKAKKIQRLSAVTDECLDEQLIPVPAKGGGYGLMRA
jgi:hypothetical protein